MLQLFVITSNLNNKSAFYLVVILFYTVWKNYHTRSFQLCYYKNLRFDLKYDVVAVLV